MPKNNKKTTIKAPTHLALTTEYIQTQKFKDWCKYFFDKANKETYGNATRSALRVYNTESVNSASQIGHENLRKLKDLRLSIADQEGFGLADMMKIGLTKMMSGEFSDWDKMMIRLGYFEPDPKNVQATQNNFNFNFGSMSEAIEADRKARGLTV